jgi:glycosyltransferase involved in cell wall biosynthesis
MKNILIIAYYFPPMGLSGVQRTLKFAKYLPQFGWQPTILTVAPTGYYAHDLSLLEEAEAAGISIVRTGSLDLNRLLSRKGTIKIPHEKIRTFLSKLSQSFFIPDNKIGWRKRAIKKAEELIQQIEFSVIFATAPPYTDFLIGRYLREKYHIPLVIDYRDAWYDNPNHFYLTPLHRLVHRWLEKRVLKSIDKIIVINRRIKELLLKRYEFLRYDEVEIVPQGYDPADFSLQPKTVLPKSKKMRITYSGIFTGSQTPQYFLEALAKVFEEHSTLRGSIEACFMGAFRDENKKYIQQYNLQDDVVILGYLDHIECIKYLLASDVLWIMIGSTKGSDMVSTGKLYEYLGARKPILGCVPEGVARQTIIEAGGVIVDPTDVDGIADAILRFYEKYRKKELKGPPEEIVQRYDRVSLTGEVAKFMEFLVDYPHQIDQVQI